MAAAEDRSDPRPSRALQALAWVGAGLGLALVTAALAVAILTQTDRGRHRVLQYTLRALGKGIHGTLQVDSLSGNLLTGAHLYRVSLRDETGAPFVIADSALLDYDARTLATARIRIDSAILYNPKIYVTQFPGDTLWNYQRIFSGPDTSRTPAPERYTLIGHADLVNADVKVQLPWEPDEWLSPQAKRQQVREALADTSPVMVRRVRGGYQRTILLDGVHGGLSRIRFAPGTQAGSYFAFDSLSGKVRFYRRPFEVRDLRGELAFVGDTIEFRAPRFYLPHSRASSFGTIRFGKRGEDPRYDVTFDSDSLALRDLRWLYPRFPSDATGAMSMVMETRPDGMLFLARNVRLQAPGTRVRGDFGMVVGTDTLRFVDVNLRAGPLRIGVIEQMLPDSLPVKGLHIGGVEVHGPAAAPRRAPRAR